MTPELCDRTRGIALVLQGGGSLGAYQAGVFQALHEKGLVPDWIIGTSIGAINAALMAGNPPETRLAKLKAFWERVSHADLFDLQGVADAARQWNTQVTTWDTFARGVPGFFNLRPFNPFAAGFPVAPEQASFYDTSPLRATLTELVDIDYLNKPEGIRLTVSATGVTSGELTHFDTRKTAVGIDHVMASGALPPGFAPVRIDGKLYWDGGLYSNTPLEAVLDDEPRRNTLCFMVDLWNAMGPEPRTLEEVLTRQKDVTYASRSQRHIDDYLRLHRLRRTARQLYAQIPIERRSPVDLEAIEALGCNTTIHIVRLAYSGHDWQMSAKDANFSKGSIEWRWEQGYAHALKAITQTDWLAYTPDENGVVLHEIAEGDTLSPVK